MNQLTNDFFTAYEARHPLKTVYTDKTPREMMASPVDKEGWFDWKRVSGTLQPADSKSLEREFKVQFPPSFIEWHQAHFFLDADWVLLRLPPSNPLEPLKEVRKGLDWYIPKHLIPQKLFPFADDGNDAGPLVFGAREPKPEGEFPIRAYEQDYGGDPNGLSDIIFSNFPKLLECMTHFMQEQKHREMFEIVPDFFKIDPEGAGKTGAWYWTQWVDGLRPSDE